MARSTDNLLALLRRLMQQRGTNVAALADKTGIPRAHLRRVLSGSQPMLVEELVSVSTALDLKPQELGVPDDVATVAGAEVKDLPEAPSQAIDPFGNHTEQLFRIGFALGCDFAFVARADALGDSGVPAPVLARSPGGRLVFTLDARYHPDNGPRYDPEGVTLTLSFDRLVDCRFPFASVVQVMFTPLAAETSEPEPETTEAPKKPGRPNLRLVT
jgi:transcriptional regulator with XRE-family HTH domain